MHYLNIAQNEIQPNTYQPGQTVTYRNPSGALVIVTVITDRGGERVKVKNDRGFSDFIQRSAIVEQNPLVVTFSLAVWERSTAYRLLCAWRAAGCPAYVPTDPDEIAAIAAACKCGNETRFCQCVVEESDDE